MFDQNWPCIPKTENTRLCMTAWRRATTSPSGFTVGFRASRTTAWNTFVNWRSCPARASSKISVGNGANLPYLRPDIELFGLDLSWGMLRRCRHKVKRWQRNAQLFQGEAERLPFRDAVFDWVFHVGGINFFSDKARAITEMIRVAKPGTKILIVDEMEKVVSRQYQKNPLTRRYFAGRDQAVSCPIDLVPVEMGEIKAREFEEGKLD
jgi:SAM-dependent methyltransferase